MPNANRRKLPIGIQTFSDIREGNYYGRALGQIKHKGNVLCCWFFLVWFCRQVHTQCTHDGQHR
ncbi:MAG: hypothetical protein VYB20_12085, partial [Pseudomonadota bacterium]|nr:hypothetical protein [Pseudomonadota bacterium]